MNIPGSCNHEASERYRLRFPMLAPDHFTTQRGVWLSSIGLGTYASSDAGSNCAALGDAMRFLLDHGCNVIDTAPNYADGQAEGVIGEVLTQTTGDRGGLSRESIFIATKVGLVPRKYERGTIPDVGGGHSATLVEHGFCFDPPYIRWQVERSCEELCLETIDCVYLHNIDAYCRIRGTAECHSMVASAATVLEDLVDQGLIRAYGVSSWTGFRDSPDSPGYLSLVDLSNVVRCAVGPDAHFWYLQAPVGLWAPEAISCQNQKDPRTGASVSLLRAAGALGLTVFANGALLQGELIGLPELELNHGISDLTGPLQAIQFSRSIPGIASILVGMHQRNHYMQNVSLFSVPKASLASSFG